MNRWRIIGIIILAAVAGGGTFAATRAMKGAPTASAPDEAAIDVLMDWLNAEPAQRKELREHDPEFAADLKTLRAQLHVRRVELAATLEDASAKDETIRAKADAVMQTSNELERRVLDYLLAARPHLTPQQQQRLFSLAAEGLRQGPGWCWKHGGEGGGGGGRWRRGQ